MERETQTLTDNEALLASLDDPSLFSIIVDRYQQAFLRKARGLTGNIDDAQDIVQEAFVKIYINADKFEEREGASFSSWAYRILINTCLTYLKKRKICVAYDDALEYEVEVEGYEEDLSERFLLVASKIPEKFSSLLRQVVIESKTYSEIAEREGLQEGAVRVNIHRAKIAFKKVLAENSHL